MAKPIFVLGKHRSGTTWLANQLSSHPQIAAALHEKHFGLHESSFFYDIYGRYGDLNNKSNFVEFAETVGRSDYFTLVGASPAFLYSLWPTTYEALFRAVMDRFAQQQEAAFWLEKTPSHTLFINELASFYPDALFVATLRDVVDVVNSAINMDAEDHTARRLRSIISATVGWAHYRKILLNFTARSNRLLVVQFADMKADLEQVLRRVCLFLDIEFDARMLEQQYKKNTSFSPENKKQTARLSRAETGLVRLVARLIPLVPASLINRRVKPNWKQRNRQSLPAWFFRLTHGTDDPSRDFGRSILSSSDQSPTS
jgi:hypothetical protein